MMKNARWMFVVLCCTAGFVCTALQAPSADTEKDDEYYELMRVFVDTFEQIDRNYVKDIDRRELMEAAIQGMISRLDQYSTFISPEEVADFNQDVEKEFGGIGIQVQINPRDGRLTVMTPLPGTPAYKAGVRAGDVIMEIEGQKTEGFSIADAIRLLKGPAGESVKIGVRHEGSEEIIPLTITREVIQVATVLGDEYNEDGSWNFMIDSDKRIAYIRLTNFSRRSAQELHDAMLALTEQDLQGLILDLRFNPGGLLSQAVEISDLFIDSGAIVSTRGRNTRERTWSATKPGSFTDFPMVVMVNRFSASASEIVSACLQDHERAVVVGERTWGKGSVQNVIELEGGSSALKLTTASYHRPSGKNIHRFPGATDADEWGVMPNDGFDVRFERDDMTRYLEYRRERDVLKAGGPPESDFEDKQLAKALEYLHAEIEKPKAAAESN